MIKENSVANQGFITSRYGKIDFVEVYDYIYSPRLNQKKDIKQDLVFKLRSKDFLPLFQFTKNGFQTLSPMPEDNWKFIFKGKKKVLPLFENILILSRYLHKMFDHQIQNQYPCFGADFVYNETINLDFKLVSCFNYNVELFEDGRFLLHFYGMSHISLIHDRINHILKIVKSIKIKEDDDYWPRFFIVDKKFGKSKVIHPLIDKSIEELKRFWKLYPDHDYTFDYQFMNRYFATTLNSFMSQSKIKLNSIYTVFRKASSVLQDENGVRLYEKPLLPVNLQSVKPEMNLMIGNNKIVSKLSASYYSGLFFPVKNTIILPLLFTKDTNVLPKIKRLIDQHFNSNGTVIWLPATFADSTFDFVEIFKLNKEYPSMFIMIFTDYMLSNEQLQNFRDKRIKYQIIKLPADQFQLSNFAVKCLHKMGAKVALLNNLGVKKETYFVGIDLGHFFGNKNISGFSNLVLVFFTSHGEHIFTATAKGLPLNEGLNQEYVTEALNKFKNQLTLTKRKMPTQLVFHRDGKLHKDDHIHLLQGVKDVFNIHDVDIVEIIKSGFPYIVTTDESKLMNAASGQYWHIKDKDYALLITNDQVINQGEVLNPIIIKRRYDNLPFDTIVSQVYWFCKLYTNNIYYPSRLPATTELANNRAGTGITEYIASYKKD